LYPLYQYSGWSVGPWSVVFWYADQMDVERTMEFILQQQARTEAAMARTDAAMTRTEAAIAALTGRAAKTDARAAKTDARLDRLSRKVDAIAALLEAGIRRVMKYEVKTERRFAEMAEAQRKLTEDVRRWGRRSANGRR